MKSIRSVVLLVVTTIIAFGLGLLVGYDLKLGVYSPTALEEMIESGEFKVGSSLEDLPAKKPRLVGRVEGEKGVVEKRLLFSDSDSAVLVITRDSIVSQLIHLK